MICEFRFKDAILLHKPLNTLLDPIGDEVDGIHRRRLAC